MTKAKTSNHNYHFDKSDRFEKTMDLAIKYGFQMIDSTFYKQAKCLNERRVLLKRGWLA